MKSNFPPRKSRPGLQSLLALCKIFVALILNILGQWLQMAGGRPLSELRTRLLILADTGWGLRLTTSCAWGWDTLSAVLTSLLVILISLLDLNKTVGGWVRYLLVRIGQSSMWGDIFCLNCQFYNVSIGPVQPALKSPVNIESKNLSFHSFPTTKLNFCNVRNCVYGLTFSSGSM